MHSSEQIAKYFNIQHEVLFHWCNDDYIEMTEDKMISERDDMLIKTDNETFLMSDSAVLVYGAKLKSELGVKFKEMLMNGAVEVDIAQEFSKDGIHYKDVYKKIKEIL